MNHSETVLFGGKKYFIDPVTDGFIPRFTCAHFLSKMVEMASNKEKII
jgi:hypothetical protein